MAKATDKKLGWHFLPKSMKLDYGDNRKAEVGKTLSVLDKNATIQSCSTGMHASEKVKDAASFEKGPVLTRVEVSGELHHHYDGKKFAGRNRKVLWAKQVTVDDVRELGQILGDQDMIDAGNRDSVEAHLSTAATNHDAFETAIRQWARKHGCPNIKEKKLAAPKPRFSAKDVLAALDTRTVVTKHELLRSMASKGLSSKPADSGYYGDRLEELLDGDLCGRVHVIEDFTRHGGQGLLRINKK